MDVSVIVDRPADWAPFWGPGQPDRQAKWRAYKPQGYMAALVAEMGAGELQATDWQPTDWPSTGVFGSAGFWQQMILLADSPRSQYDALRRASSQQGAAPGALACVALQGRGFHGQHGRHWRVAAGNLHLSVVIPCDLPAASFAPAMPALPAVAVVETINKLSAGAVQPDIKWVNDILLGGQKVAGVLTALRTLNGRITEVFMGVGLNLAVAPELVTDPTSGADLLALPATSLGARMHPAVPSLPETLAMMLTNLAEQFGCLEKEGPTALVQAYRNHARMVGREVAIWPDAAADVGAESGPLHRGEVLAIGPDLSLRLRGVADPIISGRLTFIRPGT